MIITVSSDTIRNSQRFTINEIPTTLIRQHHREVKLVLYKLSTVDRLMKKIKFRSGVNSDVCEIKWWNE